MLSKTQKALNLLDKTPRMTARAAAMAVGVSSSAVYQALNRRNGRTICPCCGQTVRAGFEIKQVEK